MTRILEQRKRAILRKREERSRWRRIVFLTVMAMLVLVPVVSFAAKGTHSAPKLLNLYLGWRIADQDQAALAKWDMVVLDMDMQWQDPDRMRALRAANPNIKILAYVSAGELAVARGQGDRTSPGYHLSQVAAESMYMHRADGQRMSWWPGAHLMNATDQAPTENGRRWNDVLPTFVRDELMSTGLWDGVFLDSAYSNVTYFFGNDIDMNDDGRADEPAVVNAAWQSGMSTLIKNMRAAIGPNRLMMNNSSPAYASQVNGVLFENFPRSGWSNTFLDYQSTIAKSAKPNVSALNTNTNNQEKPEDYKLMRFGLASALLGDGYYSFDAGDRGHERTWWYDEYDVALGVAKGAAKRVGGSGAGVWVRQFERGYVAVNAEQTAQTVNLPGVYEKIHGTQDAGTNNGQLVRSITLPAQDGIIVMGRSDATEVRGGAYVNGSFVRVYEEDGTQVRNGFFAQRDDVASGAVVLVADLDRSGGDWVVTADRGVVTVKSPSGKATTFRPFGSAYRGRLTLAVGNTNRDADPELIVGRDKSKPSDVRIFTRTGKVLARWVGYNASFAGGARVGIGDLNGDGTREIVTGAGPGGGPHIRIFKTDGSVWGGSFFAFNQTERGGVTIAVGDVDQDGNDEIVVGSGEGAIPRVRIFDFRGTLKRELTLGSKPLLGGLSVTISDVNGDGNNEILVGGLPAI